MDFPHILALEASAGSGKTRALSERYIELLLDIGALPRNILAITFTNKAMGEMKDKIIVSLKEKALSNSPVRDLASEKLEELLAKYPDFRVQTIDSFLASIVKSSALELGLPPQFEVIPESPSHLNLALDELFLHIYPDSQGSLRHSRRAHTDRKDKEITACFLNLIRELLQANREIDWNIREVILRNISELRKGTSAGEKLKEVFSYKDAERKRKEIEKSVKVFLERYKDAFNPDFTNAAHKLLTKKQFLPWESKMFLKKSAAELCKRSSLVSFPPDEEWEKIRGSISSLAEITAHCHFAPFIGLFTLFEETMRTLKNRERIIFVEELSAQLKTFLASDGTVPEIYFHLGERISHFLIDEFQDTSRSQWESLFPLIEEALSGEGSFFYVGDKKQSIYGFRGAEPALFDEAKNAFQSVKKENIKEEFPQINYRSRKEIVSFINKIFSPENLTVWAESCEIGKQLPEFSTAAYAHSKQSEQKEGGLVRIEKIFPSSGKDGLNAKIEKRLIELIQDIRCRIPARDIAVLVRKNAEASWITRILSGAGIQVASEKTLNISSNYLVQEIVSFLKFLEAPPDDLSFASFISGDIFLKSIAATREDILSFLLHNRQRKNPLYVIFRDSFSDVWVEFIEEFFHAVGFLPPYELVCGILRKYDVFRNFPDAEGFFYQLLESIKISEGKGAGTLKAFLSIWESSEEKKEDFQVVLPEYTNAIKVMTIHAAKGLGFPVVIIPLAYLEKKPIAELYSKEKDGLVPYRLRKGQDMINASPRLKELYRKELTAQILSEINTFYVAVTRAESELYIFVPEGMRGKLPPPVITEEAVLEFGTPLACFAPAPEKKRASSIPLYVSEWQEKLHRPPAAEYVLKPSQERRARERGTLAHKLLSRIEKLPESWEEKIEELISGLPEEEKEVAPLIKDFLGKKEFQRWFLLPDNVKVFSELEIVDRSGAVHRIDRLLVSEKNALLIEFKCGEEHREEHKKQVTTYLRLLKEIFPSKNIEGWLVYIDEMAEKKIKLSV